MSGTPKLSRYALKVLREIKARHAPTSAASCGAVRMLLREGFLEKAVLPSPIDGKPSVRIQITPKGAEKLRSG